MNKEPCLQFSVRCKSGLELHTLDDNRKLCQGVSFSTGENVKQSRWSNNGLYFVYSLLSSLVICIWKDNELVELTRENVNCADFVISPSGKYLATFEKPNSAGNQQHFNLTIWKVPPSNTGHLIKLGSFSHKTQLTWTPQWTNDESYFARMASNEVQFYRSESVERVAFKIQNENIGGFSISPGSYPKVAIFIKESKGQPGAVKIFLLPNTTSPMAQKMFYKADRCNFFWSPSGKHLLAMSQTEVDTTGESYYGETNLYFLTGDGSFDSRVTLDKDGPIHDVSWSPCHDEFIVLYGYMPSKAMLFDNKCNPMFEFPVGSKNHVKWNSQGSLICFGGFGNLSGQVEIWSRSGSIRRIGHFQSQSSTICEWGPNGATLITAVLTPRLRVDNNFKIWSWDGSLLDSKSYDELYSANWRPTDKSQFSQVDVSKVPLQASGLLNNESAIKKEAYRPPGLRSQVAKPSPTPIIQASKPAPVINAPSMLSKEEKQVKKIKEKLDQIIMLKKKKEAGETLELNQLEKIDRENEVLEEYNKLMMNLNLKSPSQN